MSSDDPLSHVQFGAVITPGARVLLTVDQHFRAADADHMYERLTARFPGVEFTFVHANGVAVQHAAEVDRG